MQAAIQLQSSAPPTCIQGYTLLVQMLDLCTLTRPEDLPECMDLLRSTTVVQHASDMLAKCMWHARHQEQWYVGSTSVRVLMSLLAVACSRDDYRQHFLRDKRLVPAALEAMRMHPQDWLLQRAGGQICLTHHMLNVEVSGCVHSSYES